MYSYIMITRIVAYDLQQCTDMIQTSLFCELITNGQISNCHYDYNSERLFLIFFFCQYKDECIIVYPSLKAIYTHTQNMPSSRQKEDSKKEQEEKKPKSRETAVSHDALSGY